MAFKIACFVLIVVVTCHGHPYGAHIESHRGKEHTSQPGYQDGVNVALLGPGGIKHSGQSGTKEISKSHGETEHGIGVGKGYNGGQGGIGGGYGANKQFLGAKDSQGGFVGDHGSSQGGYGGKTIDGLPETGFSGGHGGFSGVSGSSGGHVIKIDDGGLIGYGSGKDGRGGATGGHDSSQGGSVRKGDQSGYNRGYSDRLIFSDNFSQGTTDGGHTGNQGEYGGKGGRGGLIGGYGGSQDLFGGQGSQGSLTGSRGSQSELGQHGEEYGSSRGLVGGYGSQEGFRRSYGSDQNRGDRKGIEGGYSGNQGYFDGIFGKQYHSLMPTGDGDGEFRRDSVNGATRRQQGGYGGHSSGGYGHGY